MAAAELSPGEIELLIDGLGDDVSLNWALIHLGIKINPERQPSWTPTSADLDDAFTSFRRLADGGYAEICDTRASADGPPTRLVPIEHVPEHIAGIRAQVDRAVAAATQDTDWAFQCWIVNTPKGDAVAKGALGEE